MNGNFQNKINNNILNILKMYIIIQNIKEQKSVLYLLLLQYFRGANLYSIFFNMNLILPFYDMAL